MFVIRVGRQYLQGDPVWGYIRWGGKDDEWAFKYETREGAEKAAKKILHGPLEHCREVAKMPAFVIEECE